MRHRFLVERDAVRAGTVSFAPDQAHQIRDVLRLQTGDTVTAFDGVERVDHVVELVDARHGRVIAQRPQAAEPRTQLSVYPALLQRDKFETVLQKLTEIGAAAIVPVLTTRSLVRQPLDQQRLERWRAILREATEQCGRGVVPALGQALPLSAALARACAEGIAVLAYEDERRGTLRQALAPAPSNVSVFVGPEGGYGPDEIENARAAGARLVTLGPRILRAETASVILAALVLYELGDLWSEPS